MYYLGTPFGAGLSQAVLSTEEQSRPTVFLYYGGKNGDERAAGHKVYGAWPAAAL